MKNKKYINIILVVVLFFFFSIIGYLVPYTNDDWAWGSYIGIDRLNNFFSNYNIDDLYNEVCWKQGLTNGTFMS